MKYIRTDDNIYKISKILKNGNFLIKGKFHIDKNLANYFKLADTIEELCDEFVLVIDDKIHQLILGETTLKDEINIIKHNKLHKIYGAIWTSKGLIFVAKMNNKGELELI